MPDADSIAVTERVGSNPDPSSSPLRASILKILAQAPADPDIAYRISLFQDAEDFADGMAIWFGSDFLRGKTISRIKLLIDRDIAELDDAINRTVNGIMHAERFQKIETIWRSVQWLLQDVSSDDGIEVRLLDARWSEIVKDLDKVPEFDQSELFNKIYNEEFGMPGGIPYSMLIGDYYMRHRPSPDHPTDDVSGLRNISKVAAASFAPFITGVSPTLFGVDHYSELDLRQSISLTLKQVEYARWRSLQENPDGRFIGLAAPRFLMRRSHRGRSIADPGFIFRETVGRQDNTDRLWANGAFAFAQIAIRSFMDYRWLAAIRGTPQDMIAGGVVSGAPHEDFETDAPDTAVKFSPEVALSEVLDRDLNDNGFICMRPCKETSFSAFYSLPSMHRSMKNYGSAVARANEQLSSMLNYVLCVSRFAHYIKVIARDWVGSYKSAMDCQKLLQQWLHKYCSGDTDATFEMKSRYPLQDGRVTVSEIPGQPGHYNCTLALKPHFQLDQIISEFQVVTNLDNIKRAA
jgi:type VI secretion system protein ImpD